MAMNSSCPRCTDQALVRVPGALYCLACGYEEAEDDLSPYVELMASLPRAPLPIDRPERHDDEMRRAGDVALAKEAAQRHGVSLEDLRQRVNWKSTPLPIRVALQATIADLTVSGLGILRIANVLGKNRRTIGRSPGLARGRAARKQAILHREVVEAKSKYKGRTPNVIVRRRAG